MLEPHLSFQEIQETLSSGKTTCCEIINAYLTRIEKHSHLNAFLEVFEDSALSKARAVDQEIKSGKAGKLAGMVIGIKDNICYKSHKCSASSKILDGFTSLYSATAVERLLKEDAIIIGRLNCDEFGMGGSNEHSAFGHVLNPHDNSKVPGGSSGGAATAVAAGLCTAALGSDTGGSIRQPASFCGVVGLKPTYGRVSRWGLIAYGSSFDQIGPITKNVEDAALILEVIAGADEFDSTASLKSVPAYSKGIQLHDNMKIACLKDCIDHDKTAPEIKSRMDEIIQELEKQSHTVETVDFPYLDYLVPAYYLLTTAEASSNLARYDGVHYGHRAENIKNTDTLYKKSRTNGFGKEVKRRIMLGTFVLSAGYYDAYYEKAQKARRLIQQKTIEILKKYDFILLPTTPHTAFGIGEISDPVSMYLEDIFTVQASLCGLPAISLPIGEKINGLPFGMQLIANKFEEEKLIAFSKSLLENFRDPVPV